MPELKGGGAEKVLIDILKHFDYRLYDVTLLLIEKVGVYLNSIPSQVRVKHLFEEGYKLPVFTNSRYLRKAFRRLKLYSKLGFSHYDTIISFLEGEALLYHSLITHRAARNVSWVHIDLFRNHWSQAFFWDKKEEQSCYEKMDAVVCVSHNAQEAMQSLFPSLKNLMTIYNLIDAGTIRSQSLEENVKKPDGFLVCGCGRLVEQKRFDRFIEAIEKVNSKGYNISAWIIGSGPLRPILEKQASKTGIVKFLGFHKNPMPYLNAADAFVLSSDTEGFSLVVCEAISLGKPIIATKCTGPNELLAGGVGLLTEFTSDDIADAICSIIENRELLEKYTNASIKKSKTFCPDEVMAEIYRTIG